MKAAVIHEAGQPPRYDDFDDPVPHEGEQLITVTAAALTNITRSRAAGIHHTSHGILPAVAGVDGVGRLDDGRRLYFAAARPPFGSMAERCVIGPWASEPPEALDDVTVAGLMNPGVSAWMSLAYRAELRPGERVLVIGATGVTGRLAVQVATLLGAAEVTAVGRNPDSLRRLAELGADVTMQLGDDPVEQFDSILGGGVDVIIDYLWGPATEALLTALSHHNADSTGRRIRLIQVGAMAAPTLTFPAEILRSTDLVVLGNGFGTMRPDHMAEAARRVLGAAANGELTVDTRAVPLAEVEKVWNADGHGTRTVVVP